MHKLLKKSAAIGILFGVSAGIFAMLPASRHTEAAIAVWDEKNIEQAIQMVTQTASILSDQDKQLILSILNSKKLSEDTILRYIQGVEQMDKNSPLHGDIVIPDGLGSNWDEYKKQHPEYNKAANATQQANAMLQASWIDKLGDLSLVLNGQETVAGAYMSEIKREKALNATYLNAAREAQQAQMSNDDIAEMTNTLLNDSYQAEGQMQAMQIGNNINAQGVYALLMMNKQIAAQYKAQAAYMQSQNIEKAAVEAHERAVRERARKAAGIESE